MLTVSSITVPRSPKLLQEHGITHVMSLTSHRARPSFDEDLGLQHIHVDIDDNPYEDILMSLEALCSWIEDALSPNQKDSHDAADKSELEPDVHRVRTPRVLVHCIQGISRSGAVIVAYLMRTLSLDYEAALALARESRPVIFPNSGFSDQLRLWREMGLSIYAHPENGSESAGIITTKIYDTWKENRGVLLSRDQQEKQKLAMKSMAEMAAWFGNRKMERKVEKETEKT